MEARGQVNKYICQACRRSHLTINLSHGVTPFSTLCPLCQSYRCYSSMYRLDLAVVTVTHCWYRPIPDEFETLDDDMKYHIICGGLLKALLGLQCVLNPDPIRLGGDCRVLLERVYSYVCD